MLSIAFKVEMGTDRNERNKKTRANDVLLHYYYISTIRDLIINEPIFYYTL